MEFKGIEVGVEYAVRFRTAVGEPLVRIRILDKVQRNHQLKVRHIGGDHDGMDEPAPGVVVWKEAKTFLRDEQRIQVIIDRCGSYDRVTEDTIQLVFESSGETELNVDNLGRVRSSPTALERFLDRAQVTEPLDRIDPLSFVDRQGEHQMSLIGGEAIAKAFALAEPDTVGMHVLTEEDELLASGYDPGERYQHEWLRSRRPVLALARSWTGVDHELSSLQKEISRLRIILAMAVSDIRNAGHDREAARLERLMNGR